MQGKLFRAKILLFKIEQLIILVVMSIDSFQRDLVNKLNHKASSKISTDAVLFKAFKFFDLNSVGFVPRTQFFRTMAKIGVVIDDPQQMDQVFAYYDKKKQGKIYYADFIEQILFRSNNDPSSVNSRPSLSSQGERQTPLSKSFRKQQPRDSRNRLNTQKLSPEQITESIKKELRQQGVTGLLNLALNMKNLDNQRTHHLSLTKYGLVFNSLSTEDIKTFLKLFNQSPEGEVNYAEIAYYLRGKQSQEIEQFLEQLFRDYDIHQEGQVPIEDIVNKIPGSKRQFDNLNKAMKLYCKFQGIDDGIFTQDDFLDFYGFLQFYFDSDQKFKNYVLNNEIQKSERSVASNSKRQFVHENKSIYGKISQDASNYDFKKNKDLNEQQKYSYPKQQNYETSSQDLSSDDKISKRSVRSKATSHLTETPSLRNILDRVKGSLSNKGTMRFLVFQKALRGVDFDQDSLININQLKKVIKDLRIGISEVETQILFENFDINQVGLMSYPELVFEVRGDTPQHRMKMINRIWERVKESENTTSFTKLKSIFQPRAHPDLKIAKRHQEDIYKEFIDTVLLIQDLNGTRSQQIQKDTFIQYLQNVSSSIEDDKFFDVAMIGLWKLTNQTKIEEQYAGSKKKFQVGKKAYLQDFHKSTVAGGSSSDHAPFGTFKGPVNYTTQNRAAYEI